MEGGSGSDEHAAGLLSSTTSSARRPCLIKLCYGDDRVLLTKTSTLQDAITYARNRFELKNARDYPNVDLTFELDGQVFTIGDTAAWTLVGDMAVVDVRAKKAQRRIHADNIDSSRDSKQPTKRHRASYVASDTDSQASSPGDDARDAPETRSSKERSDKISISVMIDAKRSYSYRLYKTSEIGTIHAAIAKAEGCAADTFDICWDGQRCKLDQTLSDLDIEDGDQLESRPAQVS